MTKNEFLQLLSNTLGSSEKLTLNTKKTEIIEWDSMGQIGILSMLEDEFGVVLEMDELISLQTVQDIVDILIHRNIPLD